MMSTQMQLVTLLFLRREGEILLAMKKRGFGAGKWNGTGGKVKPTESVRAGAIRECQEEIGVTPIDPKLIGRIKFFDAHDPSFCNNAHICVATNWHGKPQETGEMRPQWFKDSALPFDQMWADDYLWLPLLLAGKSFRGSFTLADNEVVQHDIEETVNFARENMHANN